MAAVAPAHAEKAFDAAGRARDTLTAWTRAVPPQALACSETRWRVWRNPQWLRLGLGSSQRPLLLDAGAPDAGALDGGSDGGAVDGGSDGGANACAGLMCVRGEVCVAGVCLAECGLTLCNLGEVCMLGACQLDPLLCGTVRCPRGQTCISGMCQ